MQQIEVDGAAIAYDDIGDGDPVIFVHGLGSSARDWERQLDVFSATHRMITVDLRGHGRSDKPGGPYSIEMFASDVAALIEHLHLAPASVVGISLGGMVAFQLAATRPELIDKIAIVNALPDNDLLAEAPVQIAIRKLIVRLLGLRRMGEFLAPRLFPDDDMEEERRMLVERWAENDKRAYRASFQAILDWPGVTDQLADYPGPMLMISASDDYVPLEKKQPYLDRLSQIEHVVVPNSHHAVPVERPEAFNAVLADFLG